MIVEVCGTGCPRCQTTKANVTKVIKELGLKDGEYVAVAEVKDPRLMAARGVMFTPAIVIDGVKVMEGGIPTPQEAKKWIEERLPKG